MEPIDITEDVINAEIRIYEYLGTAWSLTVRSSDRADPLRPNDKFKYKDHVYELKRIERVRSSPNDILDFACLQVG
jgi:hypothetical protein